MRASLSSLRPLWVLSAPAVALLLLPGCSHTGPGGLRINISGSQLRSDSVEETVKTTESAGGITRLLIDGDVESIQVEAGETSSEFAIATKKGVSGDDKREKLKSALKNLVTSAVREGGTLHLHAEFKAPDGDSKLEGYASYHVVVPREMALALNSRNGHINIRGAHGEILARASNGQITLEHTAGGLDLETSNGAITITDARTQKRLRAETSNGSVRCEQITADGEDLTVDLKNSNGPIDYSGDGSSFKMDTTNGNITWRPTARIPLKGASITSSNGSVQWFAGDQLSGEVEASTSNGVVHAINIPNVNIDPNDSAEAKFRMGKGGAKIKLETTNGDIRIER